MGKFNIPFAEGLAPRSGSILSNIFYFGKIFAEFLRDGVPYNGS